MTFVALRIWLLVVVSALSTAGAAAGSTRELRTDRGIVQTVSTDHLVLRELDGSLVTITVGPLTRIRVNGLPATIAVIRPGFVATAIHDDNAPAVAIRALGAAQSTVDRGTIVGLAARHLTIATPAGSRLVFLVTLRTRIRIRGLPAPRAALRPGRVVDVTHDAAGNALRIVVRPGLRG